MADQEQSGKVTLQSFIDGLETAVQNSEGNPQQFAYYLTAPIAALLGTGIISEDACMKAISMLHKLHPDVSV